MSRLEFQTKAKRVTVTLDPEVQQKIKEIQQYLSSSDKKHYSTAKIVNMVLVSGIIGSTKLSVYDWSMIKSYIMKRKIELNGIEAYDYVTNLCMAY